MADIRAFRGFRYDAVRAGSLSSVVAPPYDVVDAVLQKKLYDLSPFNAIRVELTTDAPDDDETNNKYTRAAQTLRDWLDSEALRQDTARNLYVYEQQFTVEGQSHIRRGFFARVRLVPFGEGVFPHEQTLSGPKADRLALYRATDFNISPVFGLYPDGGETFAKLEPLIRQAPPLEATDHLGVVNRLWVVSDPATISAVIGLMGPKPIFIADGHHRYETGLKYLEEKRAAGEVADNESPANYCLMMLVGMSDPGLIILPTHRLLSDLLASDLRRIESQARWAFRHRRGEHQRPRLLGNHRTRRLAERARLRHRGGQPLDRRSLARHCGDGFTRPESIDGLARPRREHPAQARDRETARRLAGVPLRASAPGSDGRSRGEVLPDRLPRAAGDDGRCRDDCREPRKNAAEIDLFLPEDSDRDCVQLVEERLMTSEHLQFLSSHWQGGHCQIFTLARRTRRCI